MNSYTLTSKQFKKNIGLSFLLIVVTFIFIDIFLILYSDLKTTKSTFIEDKSSKIKHFELNKKMNRDIVFIGSSRTIYHISTNVFKNEGLEVYNFGVSGDFLVDYPTYIKKAFEQKPKTIVISLPITTLFQEIKEVKRPFLTDLSFYSTLKRKNLFYNAVYNWIKNMHTFLGYSEVIAVNLKWFYDKVEPSRKSLNTVVVENEVETISTDCNVFARQKINSNKIILKCTNGDGILLGNNIFSLNKEKLSNLNKNTLEILTRLVAMIKMAGIKPIIIFEPIYSNPYEYSNKDIVKYLDDSIYIDLTDLNLEQSDWADNGHLNIDGRKAYSDFLARHLKKVIR